MCVLSQEVDVTPSGAVGGYRPLCARTHAFESETNISCCVHRGGGVVPLLLVHLDNCVVGVRVTLNMVGVTVGVTVSQPACQPIVVEPVPPDECRLPVGRRTLPRQGVEMTLQPGWAEFGAGSQAGSC